MAKSSDREQIYLLVYECLEKGAFSNLVMNKDESPFVRAAVYGTLTYYYALDFLIRHITSKDVTKMDPATRTIVRIGAWQIVCSDKVPDYAAVNTSVDLARKYSKFSAGFVNAVLRKIADSDTDVRNLNNYKPEVATSLKPEIFGILKKCYGKDKALTIGKAFLEAPRISVRINTRNTNKQEIIEDLVDDGFIVKDESFIDDALIIEHNEDSSIDDSLCFRRGEFFVQGEGAMLASLIADPHKNDSILDCCSAPGGKATHMAELTDDDCKIISVDINTSRLELIKQNAERLGLESIECIESDSTNIVNTLRDYKESFDIVTADVPCSGLGLLGRKPDIRQTITYERIIELLPKQKAILDNASQFVKPGGKLIYSTCTLNKDENEKQIEEFLRNHEDFYAEDITDYLPSKLIINEERLCDARNGYITIFPDVDNTDGFFAARLRRKDK